MTTENWTRPEELSLREEVALELMAAMISNTYLTYLTADSSASYVDAAFKMADAFLDKATDDLAATAEESVGG